MEKMFTEGAIRVMMCTATLAWGVNLPAYAVIIRGTEIFDPQKGIFTDIGILDVQQIFGRAGRPQYEDMGKTIIVFDLILGELKFELFTKLLGKIYWTRVGIEQF
ncbi:unnamed protein product [Meloidogyne enterolobii]|uniref:Uncharacterized protein n=1 Tax=Meloidogyne enterolobii TaxID=390850 RepID=A0ACB1B5Y1_MELEN